MDFIDNVLTLCAVIFTYQIIWRLFFSLMKLNWGSVKIEQRNNILIYTNMYLFFVILLLKVIHLFFLISSVVLLINDFESANSSYISKFFIYLISYIVLSLSFASANLRHYQSTRFEVPVHLMELVAIISLGILAFFPKLLTYLMTNSLYTSIQNLNLVIIKIMSQPLIIIIVAIWVFYKPKRKEI
jgi:hypothetical protein